MSYLDKLTDFVENDMGSTTDNINETKTYAKTLSLEEKQLRKEARLAAKRNLRDDTNFELSIKKAYNAVGGAWNAVNDYVPFVDDDTLDIGPVRATVGGQKRIMGNKTFEDADTTMEQSQQNRQSLIEEYNNAEDDPYASHKVYQLRLLDGYNEDGTPIYTYKTGVAQTSASKRYENQWIENGYEILSEKGFDRAEDWEKEWHGNKANLADRTYGQGYNSEGESIKMNAQLMEGYTEIYNTQHFNVGETPEEIAANQEASDKLAKDYKYHDRSITGRAKNTVAAATSTVVGSLYGMADAAYELTGNDLATHEEIDKWSNDLTGYDTYFNEKASHDITKALNAYREGGSTWDFLTDATVGGLGAAPEAAAQSLAFVGMLFVPGKALQGVTKVGKAVKGMSATEKAVVMKNADTLSKLDKAVYATAGQAGFIGMSASDTSEDMDVYKKETGHDMSVGRTLGSFGINMAINNLDGFIDKKIITKEGIGSESVLKLLQSASDGKKVKLAKELTAKGFGVAADTILKEMTTEAIQAEAKAVSQQYGTVDKETGKDKTLGSILTDEKTVDDAVVGAFMTPGSVGMMKAYGKTAEMAGNAVSPKGKDLGEAKFEDDGETPVNDAARVEAGAKSTVEFNNAIANNDLGLAQAHLDVLEEDNEGIEDSRTKLKADHKAKKLRKQLDTLQENLEDALEKGDTATVADHFRGSEPKGVLTTALRSMNDKGTDQAKKDKLIEAAKANGVSEEEVASILKSEDEISKVVEDFKKNTKNSKEEVNYDVLHGPFGAVTYARKIIDAGDDNAKVDKYLEGFHRLLSGQQAKISKIEEGVPQVQDTLKKKAVSLADKYNTTPEHIAWQMGVITKTVSAKDAPKGLKTPRINLSKQDIASYLNGHSIAYVSDKMGLTGKQSENEGQWEFHKEEIARLGIKQAFGGKVDVGTTQIEEVMDTAKKEENAIATLMEVAVGGTDTKTEETTSTSADTDIHPEQQQAPEDSTTTDTTESTPETVVEETPEDVITHKGKQYKVTMTDNGPIMEEYKPEKVKVEETKPLDTETAEDGQVSIKVEPSEPVAKPKRVKTPKKEEIGTQSTMDFDTDVITDDVVDATTSKATAPKQGGGMQENITVEDGAITNASMRDEDAKHSEITKGTQDVTLSSIVVPSEVMGTGESNTVIRNKLAKGKQDLADGKTDTANAKYFEEYKVKLIEAAKGESAVRVALGFEEELDEQGGLVKAETVDYSSMQEKGKPADEKDAKIPQKELESNESTQETGIEDTAHEKAIDMKANDMGTSDGMYVRRKNYIVNKVLTIKDSVALEAAVVKNTKALDTAIKKFGDTDGRFTYLKALLKTESGKRNRVIEDEGIEPEVESYSTKVITNTRAAKNSRRHPSKILEVNPNSTSALAAEPVIGMKNTDKAQVFALAEKVKGLLEEAVIGLRSVPGDNQSDGYLTAIEQSRLRDNAALGLLYNKEGRIDLNVAAAIGLAVDEYFGVMGPNLERMTKMEIATLLGISVDAVTPAQEAKYGPLGKQRKYVAAQLGAAILSNLGLKMHHNVSQVDGPHMKAGLGQLGLLVMEAQGYIRPLETSVMKASEVESDNKADNADASLQFVQLEDSMRRYDSVDVADNTEAATEEDWMFETVEDSYETNIDGWMDEFAEYEEMSQGSKFTQAKKRAKGIQELLDTEDTAAKFPSEIAKEKRVVKIKNNNVNHSPAVNQEAINALEARKNVLHTGTVGRVFGEKNDKDRKHKIATYKLALGWKPLKVMEKSRRYSKETIEAQRSVNMGIDRETDALVEYYDLVQDGTMAGDMYFDYFLSKNGRTMLEGLINPQTSKTHRFFTSDDTQVRDIKKDSVMLKFAIGQAFGLGIDTATDEQVISFADAILNTDHKELTKAVDKLMKDPKGHVEISGVEIEIEFLSQLMVGLDTVKAYQEAKGSTFENRLLLEVDAKTSGFALKTRLFPFEEHQMMMDWSKRAGVLYGEAAIDAKGTNEMFANKEITDSYQETVIGMAGSTEELTAIVKANEEELKAKKNGGKVANSTVLASKYLGMLDEAGFAPVMTTKDDEGKVSVTKKGRNTAKPSFMTKNYGSGYKSTAGGTGRYLSEGMVDQFIADVRSGKTTPLIELVGELTGRTDFVTIADEMVDNGASTIMASVDSVGGTKIETTLEQALTDIFAASYGLDLNNQIKKVMGHFDNINTEINTAYKVMFRLYNKVYEQRIAALTDAITLTEAEEKVISKTVARAKNLGDKLSLQEATAQFKEAKITEADHNKIVKDLIEIFPSIKGPLSAEAHTDKDGKIMPMMDGIGIFTDGNVAASNNAKATTQTVNGNNASTSVQAVRKAIKEASNSGAVVPIHWLDGAIMAMIMKDKRFTNVFDAMVLDPETAVEFVKEYNRIFLELTKEWDMYTEVSIAMDRSIAAAIKLSGNSNIMNELNQENHDMGKNEVNSTGGSKLQMANEKGKMESLDLEGFANTLSDSASANKVLRERYHNMTTTSGHMVLNKESQHTIEGTKGPVKNNPTEYSKDDVARMGSSLDTQGNNGIVVPTKAIAKAKSNTEGC